ncbi:putative Mg2+ transporter-C (MgtC) family protein [Prosthecobacter debontii]|uniref:Putative Mg2+ transporter-C (MgtC) family protein n=1 Tax=Prosthecobacter debontii TaxID=48467 RepID=A0A1T4YKM8_9BACT|nr:MgtC/SapB family protein [Prosthecobacter debontii]SKB01805.1 putative Mg2+ transporter-C (MgtC) family protein [Prosthecobacter debontii]
MDWKFELLLAFRAIMAAVLGGFVGWERERHGREAGIRTYAAVSLGACIFGLISSHASTTGDPGRIAAQVVTGVGFLGAGVILRDQGRIHGLTTAATLWATASVGLAISYGMYTLGTLGALIIFSLLAAHHLPAWTRFKNRHGDCSAQRKDEQDS